MANQFIHKSAPRGSSWRDAENTEKYPALKGSLETDVAIVGGGLAGITLAYKLRERNIGCAVLQDKNLAEGATRDTTAFLMQDIDTELSELIDMFGEEKAAMVWRSHRAAIDEIERIVNREKIKCDFMRVPAYIYANDEEEIGNLEEQRKAAEKLGFTVKLSHRAEHAFLHHGHLEIPNQGKYHPLKFLFAVAKAAQKNGARIFEKSAVTDIKGAGPFQVKTSKGMIRARRIVIATYYPFKNPKATFLKKGMYRSYVLEVKIPKGVLPEALFLDMANPYNYFRVDRVGRSDRIILGGQDHRAEIKMSENKNFEALEEYLQFIFPRMKYEITRKWSGPILEPSDGLALIGETKPNQYVATAFSGNGMTYSLISAMLLSDLIAGTQSPWTELYNPNRPLGLKPTLYKGKDYVGELLGGAVKNIFRKK